MKCTPSIKVWEGEALHVLPATTLTSLSTEVNPPASTGDAVTSGGSLSLCRQHTRLNSTRAKEFKARLLLSTKKGLKKNVA